MHILLAVLLLAGSPHQVQSQQQGVCMPYGVLADRLERGYGETLAALGTARNGALRMELFTSESGSWTMVLVYPSGTACGLESGEDFDTIIQQRGKKS